MNRLALFLVALAALVLSASSAAVSVADFPLRVSSQNATTITFGWDRVTGATGFEFYAGGTRVSSTGDGNRTSVRFRKGPATFEVRALPVGTGSGFWPAVTPPPPPPPPPPPGTSCLVSNFAVWAWQDCERGTTIVSSSGWSCNRPLSQYGPLPIYVRVNGGANGVTLDAGCVGAGTDAIDLIVYVTGISQDSFKTRVSPRDVNVTGRMDCGPRGPGAHQDTMQFQGSSDIKIVNAVSGEWEAGTATCQNAGGAAFWSFRDNDVDVVGSYFVGCNHGVLGGAGRGLVRDSGFRTGAQNAACNGIVASEPCIFQGNVVRGANVTCQRWRNGAWTNS